MKLVVGLGNPGNEYSATRHNVGFMLADRLAERWEIDKWRSKDNALVAEYRAGNDTVLLVKPQTYMNLSGTAVGALARWYKVKIEDIIVAYDDLDLPVGRLRLRLQGGSGGHRGMESLLAHLGQDGFVRARIGIGRPQAGWEVVDHVLGRFTQDEVPLIDQALTKGADAVEYMLQHGAAKAMNQYNR